VQQHLLCITPRKNKYVPSSIACACFGVAAMLWFAGFLYASAVLAGVPLVFFHTSLNKSGSWRFLNAVATVGFSASPAAQWVISMNMAAPVCSYNNLWPSLHAHAPHPLRHRYARKYRAANCLERARLPLPDTAQHARAARSERRALPFCCADACAPRRPRRCVRQNAPACACRACRRCRYNGALARVRCRLRRRLRLPLPRTPNILGRL